MFTNLSHEIRTRLTLILGPLDQLSGKTQNSEIKLSRIKENAHRLMALVTELLDFKKLENKQLQIKVRVVDLHEYLTNLMQAYESEADQREISFLLDFPDENIQLHFDPLHMEKVFFNLFSNAFKAVNQGGKILVRITRLKEEIQVNIMDNGIGIVDQLHDKLFTDYFQHNRTNSNSNGYGLGLTISKHIVDLHHGNILFKTEHTSDGYNTIFTVQLKTGPKHFSADQFAAGVAETSAGHLAEKTGNPVESNINEYDDNKLTILISEDNPELNSFLAEHLSEKYRVITTQNGREAFEQAVLQIPDMVIADIMMPLMNGLDLCQHLKMDDRTSHIPILILTARSDIDDTLQGLRSGADHYLTKPFVFEELELRITNLIAYRNRLATRLSGLLQNPEVSVADDQVIEDAFIQKLIKIVHENLSDQAFGVDHLCREVGVSRTVLYKKVKSVTGITVNDLMKSVRLRQAAKLLQTNSIPVSELAETVGFSDRRYFSREFRKVFGRTPAEFAKDRLNNAGK